MAADVPQSGVYGFGLYIIIRQVYCGFSFGKYPQKELILFFSMLSVFILDLICAEPVLPALEICFDIASLPVPLSETTFDKAFFIAKIFDSEAIYGFNIFPS